MATKRHKLFDATPSKAGLKPSQFSTQPANFWFRDSHPKPPPTTPSRSGTNSRVSADGGSPPPSESKPGDEREEVDSPATEDPLASLPGAGTVIAILDTGIAHNHQAFSSVYREVKFEDKVIETRDFVAGNGDHDCEDYYGHGTQCAGAACGLSFKGWGDEEGVDQPVGDYVFNSPAPGAKLLVCKICHDESEDEPALIKATIKALDYIISRNKNTQNRQNFVNVISLSFGFDYFDWELASKIQEAVNTGIIIVCCASNDGSKIPNPISYPARLGNVLCVGACDKYGSPTQFSSQGREIDFVELGEDVWAPTVGRRDDTITAVSGTSFSTPSVAGLICRLLQDLKRLANATGQAWIYDKMHNVWCMRELLKSMAVMQGHHDKAKGYGKLIPQQYFKKGDEERVRMCKEILGVE